MQVKRKIALGLDLGTSSVGWALLEVDDAGIPISLVDLGVRHFEEVVQANSKSKELKNAARRNARQMRKNLRRRTLRRDSLLRALREAGLVSEVSTPFAESETTPHRPYEIRSQAANEAVTLIELGRALFHLGRRRGFKSNRGAKLASLQGDAEIQALLSREKSDQQPDETDKNEGPVITEINDLKDQMGELTLGQFFWQEIEEGKKVRGRHTDRKMYEEEFERIWDIQSKAHPRELTNVAKSRIYHAIFDQRPLKIQKFLKANCSLEPTKVRAERAQIIAQRFRYWQDICNLELIDGATGERRHLNEGERVHLAEKLEGTQEMDWKSVRTLLKLSSKSVFNLERAKGGKLKGNSTSAKLSRHAPELWRRLDAEGQERLVETLLTVSDRGVLYRTLRKRYLLEPDVAYRLAIIELEPGTANLSSKAMRRMLPYMKEGHSRIDAQRLAGYEPWNDEIIPLPRLESGPSRMDIPNPRVRKALGQVRKVVNAILKTYGRPNVIRIEMAREMSLSKKEREGRDKANKQLERENQEADKQLQIMGIEHPTRADRTWYRLAKQCKWICPYTGKPIEQSIESMNRFQIEHIVPYVRSLDDSFNNLTLCDADTNKAKGNKTPYEMFGHSPLWEHMVARINELQGFGSGHKRKLFLQKETPDEDKMVSRQLNETKWICGAAADYLRPVCDSIEATKGQATALLRTHWGLMQTLYGVNEKKRDDLRHHAVDAVAIAFTTRSTFQNISRHRTRAIKGGLSDYKVPPLSDKTVPTAPVWLHKSLALRLSTVVVSHEPVRGIKGAFHLGTAMGRISPGLFRLRKKLIDLTPEMTKNVVDPALRIAILEALSANGGDANKAFAEGLRIGPTVAKRARITKRIPKAPMMSVPRGEPTKHYELGNNHHVAIFEHIETGKRRGNYVTMVEVAERVRQRGEPLVDIAAFGPDWRFVMWLAANDIVRVADDEREYFRVQLLEGTNNKIVLRENRASSVTDDAQRLIKSANTLRATKLAVDPLGRVREVPEGKV